MGPRGINAKAAAPAYSRKGIEELTAYINEDFGAKGLCWFKVDDDGSLAFAPALLPRTADTAAAPLPLTPANLISSAENNPDAGAGGAA